MINRLAELFGSSTRGNVVQILASSNRPLSAYGVAKMGNKNVPKVYLERKKLSNIGVITRIKGERRRVFSRR